MAATMMYLTDQRAAKQTRLVSGTVQNQIHPGSLGWPSGRHYPKLISPAHWKNLHEGYTPYDPSIYHVRNDGAL